MKRAKDIADQSRTRRDRRKLEGDGLPLETFTLPLAAARLKARDILAGSPKSGYVSVIERWRQHPDGQIEFAMRRLPAGD
jgi:hypothetical protein